MKKSIIRRVVLFISFHKRIYIIPKISFSKNIKVMLIGSFKYIFALRILFITIEIGLLNND